MHLVICRRFRLLLCPEASLPSLLKTRLMFCQLCVGPICVAFCGLGLLGLERRLRRAGRAALLLARRFSVLWAALLPAASNPLSWKKLVKSALQGEEVAQRVRNKGILTLLLASSCLSRYSKVVAVAPGSNSAILFLCSTLIRLCWASCQKAAPALGQ